METLLGNRLFPWFLGALLGLGVFLALWLVSLVRSRRLHRRLDELDEEFQRADNQLTQARRMEAVGILAGSIVHNLNNLLAVILGHTRMAVNVTPKDSPIHEELERVTKAGHMASDLVQEISDFYRQADQAHKPTDLVPVVRDTLKLLQDILPPTVEIRHNLATRCGPVMASPTGVQQILMNLFSNSVHAIHRRQGIIEVSLSEERIEDWHKAFPQDLGPGTYVKLTVSDNGRGMDAATLDQIFNNYFSASTRGRGMGIGLSTVHRILQAHDGVTIPHSTPGHGTSFDIYFPLIAWKVEPPAAPEPAAAAVGNHVSPDSGLVQMNGRPTPAPEEPAAREATVLLVDDQEMVAQVTARGLQRMGFRVITHTDSQKALEDFMQTPEIFDVVITDQIMPAMSGVRLTRKIRSIRPDIPVLLITGFRDSFNEQQAKEAGVTGFVLKPTSHRDLADMIRRVLLRRMEEKG
jgi:two-component system cell cycle sensor histidine kinase/response regulator CckA